MPDSLQVDDDGLGQRVFGSLFCITYHTVASCQPSPNEKMEALRGLYSIPDEVVIRS